MKTLQRTTSNRVTVEWAAEVVATTGRLRLCRGGVVHTLHPLWLRERSTACGAIDPTNRQRLYEPLDLDANLAVVSCDLIADDVLLSFSDGHRCSLSLASIERSIERAATGEPDDEEPPVGVAWTAKNIDVPLVEWSRLESPDTNVATAAVVEALGAYFRSGFFVVRGTPTDPDSLYEIAGRFGRVSATNFGALFDVRTEPEPSDLAYTPIALSAHTDQPYRRPVPGIQFLHTLLNDAPGGESTVVDGLAAVDALRMVDPEAFGVLSTLPVEFRYDVGTDVKVARIPMIDLHPDGSLRQLRFSPRLDFAPAIDPDTLDVYYRGRRWLAAWLNDPTNQICFRMQAGDALVVDNHRVLHGRTSYDPTVGSRHLQGCYIDHDGPATMWTLAIRQQQQAGHR